MDLLTILGGMKFINSLELEFGDNVLMAAEKKWLCLLFIMLF